MTQLTTPPEAETDNPTSAAPTHARRRAVPRHVLLTGYPGFISKRLLRRALADLPRARFTVLVHETQKAHAEQDLRALGANAKRVEVVYGDVAKMDLGLSGTEIQALVASITHVFHLAAIQRVDVEKAEAERVNVGGTRNMLTLAREMTHLERFVHFSTCFVSGDREGVITEDELDCGQHFRNAYEETKFRGEKLARAAMSELPITVVRPAIVVGHSETGEIDRFTGIYSMGILVVTSPISVPIPLPGPGTSPLNLVPVDFVTSAVMALTFDPRAVGKTLHIVDPNPLSARHVYELVAQKAGKKLPRVTLSYSWAKRILDLPFIKRFSREQAEALAMFHHFAVYNCSNTLALLDGTGISCPRFDTYVDRLMKYVTDSLKRARRTERTPTPVDPFDG